jgi:glycerophosphoryl diester phosphodiesterase
MTFITSFMANRSPIYTRLPSSLSTNLAAIESSDKKRNDRARAFTSSAEMANGSYLTDQANTNDVALFGRNGQESAAFLNADAKGFGFAVGVGAGRYVRLRGRNDGSIYLEVPKQISPAQSRQITLPGVTTRSTKQQLSQAVLELFKRPNSIPYVYASDDDRPVYNNPGRGSTAPNYANNRKIYAHGGDREVKPSDWKESEWENSIQAISSAYQSKVGVELDLQLNKSGVLYLHHESTAEPIDAKGKVIGNAVNILTASPVDVDKVAVRLSGVLTRFDRVNYPNSSLILEMKKDTGLGSPMTKGYAEKMAKALYRELKTHDRREDVIVSSMEPEMLAELNKLASADGVKMNLMLVLGLNRSLTKSVVNDIKADMPYVNHVGFSTHIVYGPPQSTTVVPILPVKRLPIFGTTADAVDYAKAQGLRVVGWNWDPTNDLKGCRASTVRANELKLDGMITDCKTDLQNSSRQNFDSKRPWK